MNIFSLSSMLIKSVYNGKCCSADDFTSILLPHYGLCCTFNAKNDRIRNGTVLISADNGKRGGLELQLCAQSLVCVLLFVWYRNYFSMNTYFYESFCCNWLSWDGPRQSRIFSNSCRWILSGTE